MGLTTLPLHVSIVFKSGSLSLLETSGLVQGCSGIALPIYIYIYIYIYTHIKGADKPDQKGNKVGSMSRDACDFNNILTRAAIKFFPPARQDAEGNSRHSDRNISLFPSWSG